MQSTIARLARNGLLRSPQCYSSQLNASPAVRRYMSSDDRRSSDLAKGKSSENDSDDMFNDKNVSEVSQLELERMRLAYGLVKEHAEAIERGIKEVDPESNPLIDKRSFDVHRIPELPGEMLSEFRKTIPAEEAGITRPVSTYGIWEAIRNQEPHELLDEAQTTDNPEWEMVDQKTMDNRQLFRMQRQSVTNTAPSFSRAPQVSYTGQAQYKRKKRPCPLKNEQGKVQVDFRNVGGMTPFLSENLKILPRRKTGISSKAQRRFARAVKTARTMALINPEPKQKLTLEEMLEIERNLP